MCTCTLNQPIYSPKLVLSEKPTMTNVLVMFGLLLGVCRWSTAKDLGHFWHLSDMHLDYTYSTWSGSCGSDVPEVLGRYGDYACDSPWSLINNSVWAMKDLFSNPDFIIWTGDDTPHIWNDTILNQDVVYDIIDNLTSILEEVFPGEMVYSALGNHDWSPKNQLPPGPHPMYDRIADRWAKWVSGDEAIRTFHSGGYYADYLELTGNKVKMLVLNTNLYYESNGEVTRDREDPAGQLDWLETQLSDSQNKGEKVIVIGHVPPGMFEKHRSKHWFYPEKYEAFLNIVSKYSDTIGSMHFAHHHTDSFRVLYDKNRNPISSLLLAPAVTPWETTLPGVVGGAGNNPSVRLVTYDRQSGSVENILQYYLNLTEANNDSPIWRLEYNAQQYFGVMDFGTSSLHDLAEKLKKNKSLFNKYYQINGVLYDPSETCEGECHAIHFCAITEVDYVQYEDCVKTMLNNGVISLSNSALIVSAAFSCVLTLWSHN